MKKKLLTVLTVGVMAFNAIAQQPQQQIWYLNNQSIDFTGTTPVMTQGLPGNPGAGIYESRNGVHRPDGSLLFYIDGSYVVNSSGTNIGQLPSFSFPQTELNITPVPGSSCQYYVIEQFTSQFSNPCPSAGDRYNLAYTVVDMSLNNGQGGVTLPANPLLESCSYVTGSAIALGLPKSNGTQFLYEVGLNPSTFDILKYTISATGISTPTIIYTGNYSSSFARPAEMDLSFNEDKLVFTTFGNDIHIIHLDPNGDLDAAMGNPGGGFTKYTIAGQPLTGVEFSTLDNNLFVGQRNTGILVVNPNNGISSPSLNGSVNYGNSQLETAYDALGNNKIYAVDGSKFGEIGNINSGFPTFSANAVGGANYNFMQDLNTGIYQLPDQIDGFNYSSIGIGGSLDLYSKDTYNDFGVEPNMDNGPLWISEDIWVRMNNDGIQNQQTESIEFRTGEPVYVYVRVRNRSCQSSLGTETLTLNWAKASTGLSWPTDWDGSVVVSGQPYSGLVGNLTIPLIDAGNETILTFTWTPPNPDVFQAAFGTDYKHFCLLSRIQTSSTAPYGMTYPEGSNIYTNTKNNNNIVWKNVQINNDIPGIVSPGGTGVGNGAVIVRNVETIPVKIKLGFKVPVEELGNSIFDKGTIKVNLGTDLFDKWNAGGRVGNGVALAYELRSPRELDPIIGGIDISTPVLVPILTITNPNAYIGNITLAGREEHTISMEFYQDIALPAEGKNQFNYDVVQYNTNGIEEITGGERYIINALVEQTVYGTTLRKGNTSEQLTSIEDLSGNKIAIYPNPTSGEFTINLKNVSTSGVGFTLTTLEGKIIQQEQKVSSTTIVMDLSEQPKGIYLLKIEDAQSVNVYKIIRQ